ncbi:MAG TPA: peptidoglycan DD-metalloendopeptidase family protein [Clostridiales bacterium]|nr:peptidoglycan DD-metalloendopeptidase family protein [Clostridiales bacterium]
MKNLVSCPSAKEVKYIAKRDYPRLLCRMAAIFLISSILFCALAGQFSVLAASPALLWPVPASSRVTAGWGDGRNHKAIDIAAPRGTPVIAVADGVVTLADNSCTHDEGKTYNCCIAMGKYIKIQHSAKINGKTVVSRYSHLSSIDSKIKKGDFVKAGQVIGYVGSTGYSTGNHLDFKLYFDGREVDPGQYLTIPPDVYYGGSDWSVGGPYVQSLRNRINHSSKSVLRAEGYTYPISLRPGVSFKIAGAVRSNYNITSLTAGIYDTNGNAYFTKTVKPNAKTYNLSGVDADLKFNKLGTGTYIYELKAQDSSGEEMRILFQHVFTVSNSSTLSAVPGFTVPTALSPGEEFALSGIVASNYNINRFTASLINSSGKAVYEHTANPNSDRFYLDSLISRFKFASLPEGKYTFRVVAWDNSSSSGKTVINQAVTISSKTAIDGSVYISGLIRMAGREMKADTSDITPEGVKLSYQWKRNGENIPGATKSTYTPTNADVGKAITVVVTAADSKYYGSIESYPVYPLPAASDILPGKYNVDLTTMTVTPAKEGTTVKQLLDGMIESFLYSGVYEGSKKLGSNDILKTRHTLKTHLGLLSFTIVVRGDLDGNGKVNAADARVVLRYVAKLQNLNKAQIKAADADGNYTVTAADARKILRIAADLDN